LTHWEQSSRLPEATEVLRRSEEARRGMLGPEDVLSGPVCTGRGRRGRGRAGGAAHGPGVCGCGAARGAGFRGRATAQGALCQRPAVRRRHRQRRAEGRRVPPLQAVRPWEVGGRLDPRLRVWLRGHGPRPRRRSRQRVHRRPVPLVRQDAVAEPRSASPHPPMPAVAGSSATR